MGSFANLLVQQPSRRGSLPKREVLLSREESDLPTILRGLEDPSPPQRAEAIDQLRSLVRQRGGRALVGHLNGVFTTLNERLTDSSWSVAHQCMQLLAELIPEFGADLDVFFPVVLPTLVENLGDAKLVIRTASLQALKAYVQHANKAAQVLDALMGGMVSPDSRIRLESVRAIVPLFSVASDTARKGVNMPLLLESLVDAMRDAPQAMVDAAVEGVDHIRKIAPDFTAHVWSLSHDRRETLTSRWGSDSLWDVSLPSTRESSIVNMFEYGFIPLGLVKKLRDEDWKTRSGAVEKLSSLVENMADLGLHVEHLPSLIVFLLGLADDANLKISHTAISVIQGCISKAGEELGASLTSFLPPMAEKLGDTKRVIRQGVLRVFNCLMTVTKPQPVLKGLCEYTGHRNWHVREGICCVYLQALLLLPSSEFDYTLLASVLTGFLIDGKSSVRILAGEGFAVLNAKLGPANMFPLLAGVDPETLDMLHERFADPTLPQLKEDGLIDLGQGENGFMSARRRSFSAKSRQMPAEFFMERPKTQATLPSNRSSLSVGRESRSLSPARRSVALGEEVSGDTSRRPVSVIGMTRRASLSSSIESEGGSPPPPPPPLPPQQPSLGTGHVTFAPEPVVDTSLASPSWETSFSSIAMVETPEISIQMPGGPSQDSARVSRLARRVSLRKSGQLRLDDEDSSTQKAKAKRTEASPPEMFSGEGHRQPVVVSNGGALFSSRVSPLPPEGEEMAGRMRSSVDADVSSHISCPVPTDPVLLPSVTKSPRRSINVNVNNVSPHEDLTISTGPHSNVSPVSPHSSFPTSRPTTGTTNEEDVTGKLDVLKNTLKSRRRTRHQSAASTESDPLRDGEGPLVTSSKGEGLAWEDRPLPAKQGGMKEWFELLEAYTIDGGPLTTGEGGGKSADRPPQVSKATERRRQAKAGTEGGCGVTSGGSDVSRRQNGNDTGLLHVKPERGRSRSVVSFSREEEDDDPLDESLQQRSTSLSPSPGARGSRRRKTHGDVFRTPDGDEMPWGDNARSPTPSNLRSSLMDKSAHPQEDIPSEDLSPSCKPTEEMRGALSRLSASASWKDQFDALNSIRRLAIHHEDILLPRLKDVVIAVVSLADSLRSMVSKTAMVAMYDMFSHLRKSMDPHLDHIVPILLKKTTESNLFMQEQAEHALQKMVTVCSDGRSLTALMNNASHKNPVARAKVSLFLAHCVENMGPRISAAREVDRLVSVLVQFLGEGSQEARNSAKRAFWLMSNSFSPSATLEMLISRLNEGTQKKIREAIEAGRSRGEAAFDLSSVSMPKTRRSGTRAAGRVETAVPLDSDLLPVGGSLNPGSGPLEVSPHRRVSGHKKDPSAFDALPDIYKGLESTDWKVKNKAIEEVVEIICKFPQDIATKLVFIFDRLNSRVQDSNVRVSTLALQSVKVIIPELKDELEPVLMNFMGALGGNLASTNPTVRRMSSDAMDALNEHVDASLLLPCYGSIILSAKPGAKAALVEKAAALVTGAYHKKPKLVVAHILPVAFKLIDETRADTREANTRLLQTLYQIMGDSLYSAAAGTETKHRVRQMLVSGK